MIKYLGNDIEFTSDGAYRPNTLTINGELASMDCYADFHDGKNWMATASGNILYYRTESGKEYSIPQGRLMNTFQDEIREAVNSAGISLREAANVCNVSFYTMEQWRSGKSVPSNAEKERIIKTIRNN